MYSNRTKFNTTARFITKFFILTPPGILLLLILILLVSNPRLCIITEAHTFHKSSTSQIAFTFPSSYIKNKLSNHTTFQKFTKKSHSKPTSVDTLTNNNNTNMEEQTTNTMIPIIQNDMNKNNNDTKAYNQYISSSVDILPHPFINYDTYSLTFTRSARDVDTNSKRNFVHQAILIPTTTSTTTTAESQKLDIEKAIILPPIELHSKVMMTIPSPSGSYIAQFIQQDIPTSESSTSTTSTILEIWNNQHNNHSLIKKIILPTNQKLHGPICYDTSWFASNMISWNTDETFLVYSAEQKDEFTHRSFFTSSPSSSSTKEVKGTLHTLGYGAKETWGEKYVKTSILDLFLVNIQTGKVGKVQNIPTPHYTLGQAVFSPDSSHLVYVGWDAGGGGYMPKRLGSIYCYQRPCKIYSSCIQNLMKQLSSTNNDHHHDGDENNNEGIVVDSDFVCITNDDKLARSPRFIPSFTSSSSTSSKEYKLIYLCNTKGFDTHGGCMALHSIDWLGNASSSAVVNFETRREIVPVIHDVLPTLSTEMNTTFSTIPFPGLFVDQLPEGTCSSPDGRFVFANTQWGSVQKVVKIDVETGDVSAVQFHLSSTVANQNSHDYAPSVDMKASQKLLSISQHGDAIVSQSEPNSPSTIGLITRKALIASNNDVDRKNVITIATPSPICASSFSDVTTSTSSFGFSYHVISSFAPHGHVKAPVEGILLLPKSSDDNHNPKVPLIVMPHGGPHSCYSTTYLPSAAFLSGYGKYAVLLVNFRGSTGYGQAAVESLPGNIGRLDVDDVVHITKKTLEEYNDQIDSKRVGVCGGSHGGFLAGHLIGQYPELYKVCAMRNPVTNIPTMVSATDIPDWCYVESLGVGNYDWTKFRSPNKDEMIKMYDASPVAYVDNIIAPTLVALGLSDRRVPPSQGLEFYHTLRSKGIPTKLLCYDLDDHAIDKVVSEADHWINIKQWFDLHL